MTSNDLRKPFARCHELRETDKRKAVASNTAQEEEPWHDEKI